MTLSAPYVNLDYAASTPLRAEALEAMRSYDVSPIAGANPNSLHSLGREAARVLEEARRSVASSLGRGVRPQEVVFTSGGTEANVLALFGIAEAVRAKDPARTRIVIEQRHSIDFSVSVSELEGVLVDGKNGKQLRTLRLYAVDLMGNLYQGRIDAVRKLLSDVMAGKASAAPAATASASPAAAAGAEKTRPAQTAPVQTAPAQSSASPAPAPVPIREFGKDTAARKLVVGPVATPETKEKTEAFRPEDLFRKP